jgi:hypothetical protein
MSVSDRCPIRGTLHELDNAGIITLADTGCQGVEVSIVFTSKKGRNKPQQPKEKASRG